MTEELVSMQVECEPWEEASDGEDPVATPLEHLKPAGLPALEVVRDLLHPPIERPQKALELGPPALPHPLAPAPDRTLGSRLCVVAFEQVRQVFPQVVGGLDLRRGPEDSLEQCPLLRFEIPRLLAKRPHRPCDLGILGLGHGVLEPLEFLLTHRVGAVAVGSRHVEPIDDDLGPRYVLDPIVKTTAGEK